MAETKRFTINREKLAARATVTSTCIGRDWPSGPMKYAGTAAFYGFSENAWATDATTATGEALERLARVLEGVAEHVALVTESAITLPTKPDILYVDSSEINNGDVVLHAETDDPFGTVVGVVRVGDRSWIIFKETPAVSIAAKGEAIAVLRGQGDLHEADHRAGRVLDDRVCQGVGCPQGGEQPS